MGLRFGIWMGVLAAVVVVAVYAIWYIRGKLLSPDSDADTADDAPLYTTAEVERLKREGLIDDTQYEKLKAVALAAAKRRAERARQRRSKKQGLFG